MNYYEILGVRKTASQEEIKKAYKNLVKKYHPDVYKGDKTFAENKTVQINIAYDVLSNPTTKQSYDEETFKQTTYAYTPPEYKKSYTEYKEQYDFRSRNYSKNDGSEHDYSTYVNYGGPRSNYYSQTTNYSNNNNTSFTDKAFNNFYNSNSTIKIQTIIIGIIIYISLIIFAIFQVINLFEPQSKETQDSVIFFEEETESTNDYNKEPTYTNTFEEEQSQNNYSEPKQYQENFPEQEDVHNNILYDYYSETHLKELYSSFLLKTNLDISYEEFKEYLACYLYYLQNPYEL